MAFGHAKAIFSGQKLSGEHSLGDFDARTTGTGNLACCVGLLEHGWVVHLSGSRQYVRCRWHAPAVFRLAFAVIAIGYAIQCSPALSQVSSNSLSPVGPQDFLRFPVRP